MNRKIIQSCVIVTIFLLIAGAAIAQETTTAKATAVSASSGAPSSFKIRANILAQKRAAIEGQIDVAQRCVKNSSLPTVLRDPEGNVRMVPQTDVVNCARTLASLQRRLASLARESAKLSADAEAAALRLEMLQQRALASVRDYRASRTNNTSIELSSFFNPGGQKGNIFPFGNGKNLSFARSHQWRMYAPQDQIISVA